MTCVACGYEGASTARFCGSCGAPLGWRWDECGARNVDAPRFCEECGASRSPASSVESGPVRSAPIDDIAPTGRQRPPSVAESPGERRHLTVLFSDLVGSTALSERLDPEELRQLVLVYQDIAVRAIEEHGGYVANFIGDGVLAFFGYPIADELAT